MLVYNPTKSSAYRYIRSMITCPCIGVVAHRIYVGSKIYVAGNTTYILYWKGITRIEVYDYTILHVSVTFA